MRAKVLAPLLAIGLSVTGAACGGESNEAPEEIATVHAQVLDRYDCRVDKAGIIISDLGARSLAAFGDESAGKALTTGKGIEIDDNVPSKQRKSLTVHESIHWCADRNHHRYYPEALEIPGIGKMTSTEGFTPFINGDENNGNTFVEEGVVEWMAIQHEGYVPHQSYAVIAGLSDRIATTRGFDDQAVAKLLQKDDLIGLVGLMKAKPEHEVTGQDIKDIFLLYMDAGHQGRLPADEQLQAVLGAPAVPPAPAAPTPP